MNNKILLIEDDKSINEMLKNYLVIEGFNVVTAFDGEDGINKFFFGVFDLIIVDIMMPKINGIDVIQKIREKSAVPILIISARDNESDKVIGLGLGADDYIVKPFSMAEILARVKASIRRSTKYSNLKEFNPPKCITINKLCIDFNNFSVIKSGDIINLTYKEFEILKLLVMNPQKVFTKEQLYMKIWNDNFLGNDNVINVHIRRLREKIEDNPSEPKYIKTVWGIGYKLGEF